MSNSHIEAYNRNSDVGESFVSPSADAGEGLQRSQENNRSVNRQERLSVDLTNENTQNFNGESRVRTASKDLTHKSSTHYLPKRTSSAPPEEHVSEIQKSQVFQPTKTHQGLMSSPVDPTRKQYGNRSKSNSFSEADPSAETSSTTPAGVSLTAETHGGSYTTPLKEESTTEPVSGYRSNSGIANRDSPSYQQQDGSVARNTSDGHHNTNRGGYQDRNRVEGSREYNSRDNRDGRDNRDSRTSFGGRGSGSFTRSGGEGSPVPSNYNNPYSGANKRNMNPGAQQQHQSPQPNRQWNNNAPSSSSYSSDGVFRPNSMAPVFHPNAGLVPQQQFQMQQQPMFQMPVHAGMVMQDPRFPHAIVNHQQQQQHVMMQQGINQVGGPHYAYVQQQPQFNLQSQQQQQQQQRFQQQPQQLQHVFVNQQGVPIAVQQMPQMVPQQQGMLQQGVLQQGLQQQHQMPGMSFGVGLTPEQLKSNGILPQQIAVDGQQPAQQQMMSTPQQPQQMQQLSPQSGGVVGFQNMTNMTPTQQQQQQQQQQFAVFQAQQQLQQQQLYAQQQGMMQQRFAVQPGMQMVVLSTGEYVQVPVSFAQQHQQMQLQQLQQQQQQMGVNPYGNMMNTGGNLPMMASPQQQQMQPQGVPVAPLPYPHQMQQHHQPQPPRAAQPPVNQSSNPNIANHNISVGSNVGTNVSVHPSAQSSPHVTPLAAPLDTDIASSNSVGAEPAKQPLEVTQSGRDPVAVGVVEKNQQQLPSHEAAAHEVVTSAEPATHQFQSAYLDPSAPPAAVSVQQHQMEYEYQPEYSQQEFIPNGVAPPPKFQPELLVAPVVINDMVIYPAYAAAAPSTVQQSSSAARKPLVYKSKTGQNIDLKSFKKPSDGTEGQSADSETQGGAQDTPTAPVATQAPVAQVQTVEVPTAIPAAPVLTAITPPTATVITEPLQALRILSPTMNEPAKEDLPAISPVVKNLNIPVTLSSSLQTGFSISKARASSSTSPPVTEVPPPKAPVSTTPVYQSKITKKSKKDFLAAADAAAANSSSDMLSAYTAKKETVSAPAIEVAPQTPSPVDELPDSWEDESASPAPEIKAAPRSLRPGGMKSSGPQASTKLNQGFMPKKYSKQEMLLLRPPPEKQSPFTFFDNIVITQEGGASKSGPPNGGPSNWNKQPQQHHRTDSRGGEMRGNDGRDQRGPPYQNEGNEGGGSGWKRDTSLPVPVQNRKGKQQQSNVPMPKKVISDPLELLTTEVMAILNKITPQTLEKLSQRMTTISVVNTGMLDKLIELIFEKAVQEPNFTVIYADLCNYLTNNSLNWLFYMIVRDLDTGDYFWVKDFAFEAQAAGPFFSQKECVAAVSAETLPPMKPVVAALDSVEVCLTKNVLLKVQFNSASKEYFVTYLPFSDIDEEMRSQNTFPDEEQARRDAKRKNNFRSRLVNSCQNEFQNSVKNESGYKLLEEQKAALVANRANLSELEFAQQEADIDAAKTRLKRRMLGNIRFVGELYKQGLLQTGTMHSCIGELLGSPQEGWKEMREDQDIELLCRLITTVGEVLEQKSVTSKDASHGQLFYSYFERMAELARDKNLNSRMRFSIEEVISLRQNRWQARRQQEGPLKISEIHQKIEEEERRQAQIQQQQNQQHRPGQGNANVPRHIQQQHQHHSQQPLQIPKIMSRNSPAGRGGASPATNKSGRGTPGSSGNPPSFGRTVSLGPGDARQVFNDIAQAGDNAGAPIRRMQSDPSSGSHPPPPSSSSKGSGSVVVDYADPTALNRVNGMVKEYLGNNKDIDELRLRLSESPPHYHVFLVLQIANQVTDTNNAALRSNLLELLDDEAIKRALVSMQTQLEVGLMSYEPLKLLVDTTVDCKEAPERIGAVVASLVRSGAISADRVGTMVMTFKSFNVDEGNYDQAEIDATFERFLVALGKQ